MALTNPAPPAQSWDRKFADASHVQGPNSIETLRYFQQNWPSASFALRRASKAAAFARYRKHGPKYSSARSIGLSGGGQSCAKQVVEHSRSRAARA
jgi:hypothetical protein